MNCRLHSARAALAVLLLLATSTSPAPAQQAPRCKILCTPNFSVRPGFTRNHLFNAPRVRSLTTGEVKKLSGHTDLLIDFVLQIPTALPRTRLVLDVSWLPTAKAKTNPFTEYTASELDEGKIRANVPVPSATITYVVLKDEQAGGWTSITVSAGDEFSEAAQPDATSAFTHKLTLGASVDLNVFNWMPKHTWLHEVPIMISLDYVATGLPHRGDEVPKGERVFLDSVHSPSLTVQIELPLTPTKSGKPPEGGGAPTSSPER